jgi:hypothetical protein
LAAGSTSFIVHPLVETVISTECEGVKLFVLVEQKGEVVAISMMSKEIPRS